jgi:hypothetical protein
VTVSGRSGATTIDTDLVCLTDRIPVVNEFRQDADLVNGAVLFFEPRNPVIIECLDKTRQLGCTVKWGDTGPRLLTGVPQQRGF